MREAMPDDAREEVEFERAVSSPGRYYLGVALALVDALGLVLCVVARVQASLARAAWIPLGGWMFAGGILAAILASKGTDILSLLPLPPFASRVASPTIALVALAIAAAAVDCGIIHATAPTVGRHFYPLTELRHGADAGIVGFGAAMIMILGRLLAKRAR
jgi:hypothetical protein